MISTLEMSSQGNYAKGYVRWTAGGKRVMWDGCRWQQLCQIEKCLKRDQKSQGVCLIHYREQQESQINLPNKRIKHDEKSKLLPDDKAPIQTHRTSVFTRSKSNRKSNCIYFKQICCS
jgi:hypothetical protein